MESDAGRDDDFLEQDALNFPRLPCIAHTLQLVIKELMKNKAYCNLITKVKGLVKVVRGYSVGNEKLASLCGKSVVRDWATRLNSTLLMIDRLLVIRSSFEEILKELKHDSLTNTE